MANLPTKEQMLNPEVVTSVQKTYFGDWLDFTSQIPWGSPVQEISIASNKISPLKGINAINVGEGVSEPLINIISMDNFQDGQGLFLTVLQDNTTVRIKHNFGGVGSIYLFQNKDIILTSNFYILLVRKGNYWYQMNTSGYLFNDLGQIDYSLLPNGTNSILGLMRLATDSEFSSGSSQDVPPTVKQVQDKIKQINTTIDNQIIFPVGFETFTALKTAPDGWMFEQGQEVNRSDFPELFDWATKNGLVVSESDWNSQQMYGAYSSGNGSTTFRVPDLRERYIVGSKSGVNTMNKYIGDTIKNITGTVGLLGNANEYKSGALDTIYRDTFPWAGNGAYPRHSISFDASRVVPTSDRVQPRSIVRNYMVKYRSL